MESAPAATAHATRRLGVLLLAIGLAATGLWRLTRPAPPPPPPPVLFAVPAFTLVDQGGEVFRSDGLAGAPWVANLFFTSCPSICPGHMASLATLQQALRERGLAAAIVSISVDPATDTPERLAAYGERIGADPGNWHLLTGDEAAVRAVVEGGLHSAMGSPRPVSAGPGEHHSQDPASSGEPVYEISHAAYFLVVDGAGQVRALVPAEGDPVPEVLALLASL